MAQSALSVFSASLPPADNTIGLRKEDLFYGDGKASLLLRRYSETATRTRTGIVGAISGCTLQAAYSDPVLTIDLGGWVLSRGGFANAGPGVLIDSSIIANWRNGAVSEGQEDHFGWDVMKPGNKFMVQDPTFTRVPGSLSEVSLKLVLECTGVGGGTPPPVVDNGGEAPPEVSTVRRIVTVYTDKGTYQYITNSVNPTLDEFFGSSAGSWNEAEGKRPVSNMLPEYPGAEVGYPPINVLGVNVQADSGYGSVAGGEWMAGSAAEVTGAGKTLKPSGLNLYVFVLPNDGTANRYNSYLVTGSYATQADALASIGKTADDFDGIFQRGTGWTKDDQGWLGGGDPLSWFAPGS